MRAEACVQLVLRGRARTTRRRVWCRAGERRRRGGGGLQQQQQQQQQQQERRVSTAPDGRGPNLSRAEGEAAMRGGREEGPCARSRGGGGRMGEGGGVGAGKHPHRWELPDLVPLNSRWIVWMNTTFLTSAAG
jgi:hypothetical protein